MDCPFNTSVVPWLGESYRPSIYDTLPDAMNPEWTGVADVNPNVNEFWACEPGEKYVLMVISPATAVAQQLLGGDSSKYLACISEIVYMGGLFDPAQLSQTDPMTWGNAEGPRFDVYDENVTYPPELHTETNVVSDALASQQLWKDTLGIKQSIFSLETAGCDRAGLQRIFASGQTAFYDGDTQAAKQKEAEEAFMLRGAANCNGEGTPTMMLAKMVCLHNSCDTATLDFDAVAATYVWLGKEDKVKINTVQSSITVNASTGVTTKSDSNSSNMWVGTTFDALGWYGELSGVLTSR